VAAALVYRPRRKGHPSTYSEEDFTHLLEEFSLGPLPVRFRDDDGPVTYYLDDPDGDASGGDAKDLDEKIAEVSEADLRERGIRVPEDPSRPRPDDGRGIGSDPSGNGHPIRLTPARRQILESLKIAGKRMTERRILAFIWESNPDFSTHTLRLELSKLRHAEWVDNDPRARPRGYGLTDLGRSALDEADRDTL
jgi:hypothetical protein